jgi:hypothetical protein
MNLSFLRCEGIVSMNETLPYKIFVLFWRSYSLYFGTIKLRTKLKIVVSISVTCITRPLYHTVVTIQYFVECKVRLLVAEIEHRKMLSIIILVMK